MISRVNDLYLSPSLPAKVVTMGNVIETTVQTRSGGECYIRNLDKDYYLDLRTGEICQKEHIDNRSQCLASIRCTMSHIRAIINTNVIDPSKTIWLTLTYSLQDGKPMTDKDRLCSDFGAFWKRFKRYCKKMQYGIPEYITVVEPQASGAWHVHCFLIFPESRPFIPNDSETVRRYNLPPVTVTMADLWKQGFTKTKAVDNCDNIGAYFSAYLADMPVSELKEMPKDERPYFTEKDCEYHVVEDDGTPEIKKFIKGGRLHLYPPNFQIIRRSKGIKDPVIETMSQVEAEKKVSVATETFRASYIITDNDDNVLNAITKTYYNTKRKENTSNTCKTQPKL